MFFQNLNRDLEYLFHFRGSFGDYGRKSLAYEICSGFSVKLEYQHGGVDGNDCSQLSIGLLFFKLYLTFSLPRSWYFQKKCIATWDNNREFYLTDGRRYGFYFYDWAFVWHFHAKVNESSAGDPWWMRQYIHIDAFFLGRRERVVHNVLECGNAHFRIGTKLFKIDSIKWEKNQSFRRHIPFSLYHRAWYSVQMDIKKPPMYSGKGENSYDCGDDATEGISMAWEGTKPTWANAEVCTKEAVIQYIESVFKNVERYGGSSNTESGIRRGLSYQYIGREGMNTDPTACESVSK